MQCHVPSQTTSTLHRLNLKSSPLRFDPASTPEIELFPKCFPKVDNAGSRTAGPQKNYHLVFFVLFFCHLPMYLARNLMFFPL